MKLDAEKALKHLRVYEGAINAIDDYLEYSSLYTKPQLKEHILDILNYLTEELKA